MLVELTVSNLGVIDKLTLSMPLGMIALTGETGAGKTLLVDAISLLMGGRSDPGIVRPGASQAVVDGRFELDGTEMVLTRVVAAEGRSKAYIDGRPVTASALGEIGTRLVDLHGQHAHQSLLQAEAQRQALDIYGRVDTSALGQVKARLDEIDAALAELGGDERSRARELDLVGFQVDELDEADLDDPNEEDKLVTIEETLANAVDHQHTASEALAALTDDDGARDRVAALLAMIEASSPFAGLVDRLNAVVADLDDVGDAIRSIGEQIEPDPEQLDQIQTRRRMLRELRRKYGDDLAAVIAERDRLRARRLELERHDIIAEELDAERTKAVERLAEAQGIVKQARIDASPALVADIEAHLRELAMDKARVGIDVHGPDGSDVTFLLAANPGSALQPLAKVASGGELARTMLAVRSVLSEAPPVLVFDEVDAGVGGQAGFAVGRSLSNLGSHHQVLVVTHLPQVAAFADAHLMVEKLQGDDKTVSHVTLLDKDQRVVELARMLSGQPESESARQHAAELIHDATHSRNMSNR